MAAGAGIRLVIHGGPEAMRKLRSGVADVPINRFLTRGGLRMERELKAHAKVDTGTGRRSITNIVEHRRAIAGTNLMHMEVMARGRKAGKPMPPPGVLLGWMRRHGIPPGRAPKEGGKSRYYSNEFALARKIGRAGIKADDFDEKAMDAAFPGIIADVPALGREIEAAMANG